MANDKHIAIIESGVDFWNKWRIEHPEIRPDLTDADLSELNLEDVNLSSADCSGIDLHGAYLNGANFSGSDFSSANLEDANLESAKLCGTFLQGAHLGWAKLMSADLSDADLDGIELSYADLSFACLDGAHLTNASLEEATLVEVQANKADVSWTDLSNADLNGSDFSNANFYHSDLNGVNLERADLTSANLSDADLDNANLSDVNLSSANLTGTKLADADFTAAKVGFTTFVNNDLSEAKGLETVQHNGPSNIGLDTVYQSRGKVPAEFLRGAGVPEELISSLISWSEKPLVHHYSCFVSHSSKDQHFAEKLYHDLQSKGIRCWYAPEDLKAGEKFRLVIDESIRMHDKLLLILSKNSIESVWVEKETETALEIENKKKRRILLPVRIDDAVIEIENGWPADIRRSRHIGDFRGWENDERYQKAFDRLMHNLEIAQAEEN